MIFYTLIAKFSSFLLLNHANSSAPFSILNKFSSVSSLFYISQVENVKLEVPMAKCVLSCNLTVSQGKYSFDPVTRVLLWDVGKIDPTKLPNIRGNVSSGNHCILGAILMNEFFLCKYE